MEHVTIVFKVLFSIMVHDRGRVMTQSVDNSSGNGVREQERERGGGDNNVATGTDGGKKMNLIQISISPYNSVFRLMSFKFCSIVLSTFPS